MINEQSEMFKEEAFELLEELETSLLELEKTPGDTDLVRKVFRALHTIKGSGSMFGFEEIAGFAHEVENVFDLVRGDRLPVTKDLVNLALSAGDIIKRMLEQPGDDTALEGRRGEILGSLQHIASASTPAGQAAPTPLPAEPAPVESPTAGGGAAVEVTYRIRFKPSTEILRQGTDVKDLLEELTMLGTSRVIAHLHDVPTLEELQPDACYVYWDIILTTGKGMNAVKDIFIFVENVAEIKIDVIDQGPLPDEEETGYKKLGYILVEREDLSIEDMQRILRDKKLFGEMLVEEGLVAPEALESALAEQEHIREIRKQRQKDESISTLRVPSDKADKLVNLVGELVTLQARLTRISEQSDDPELLAVAEETERLVWDLRDSTMGIRMVPISTLFGRFRRLARDLSDELGREAELITEGGDTELDKTVIERLCDPLVHLIRNCIDHGIEAPEAREKRGKPRAGAIRLKASYSGANVLIVIEDDGAGIDPNKVRARAVERGLIKPDAELSGPGLFSLLFEPGFSTAKEITNVSGRGVGMDVVKKNIEALRGSIQVKSTHGKGTQVILKIPLTLAIIDGLLICIEEEHFILPLSMVEEIVELSREDIARTHGGDIANIRGKIVPYLKLRETFDISGTPPDIEQIVVVEVEHRRVGFVVDQVIGKHQTVIKTLGKIYQNVAGLSGATILGDGTVALILDVSRLAQDAELEDAADYDEG